MASSSAPSALWSVSLLTVLFATVVHSNVFGKHPPLPLSPSLSVPRPILSISPGPLTSPTLSFCLWWCPLSVDLRPFFCCFLYYDKGIREPLISTWDTPTFPGPQWNFFAVVFEECVWLARGRRTPHMHTVGPLLERLICPVACFLFPFFFSLGLLHTVKRKQTHTHTALFCFHVHLLSITPFQCLPNYICVRGSCSLVITGNHPVLFSNSSRGVCTLITRVQRRHTTLVMAEVQPVMS